MSVEDFRAEAYAANFRAGHVFGYLGESLGTEQLYAVVFDEGDDPESTHGYTWTAAEIAKYLPNFAALFTGDGTESITYVHELTRIRISPIELED